MKRAGKSMPLPAQPSDARVIFSYGGTQAPTTVEIAPVAFRWRSVLLIIFLAGFGALGAELVHAGKAGLEIGVRALLMFSFGSVFFLLLLLRGTILRERVVISRAELVVTRRDIFGTKTTRMASSEIEEVDVTRPQRDKIFGGKTTTTDGTARVVIRSDRGSIEIGEALPKQEELQWLREVLVHVLTSAPS